jgi:hypothetical protein
VFLDLAQKFTSLRLGKAMEITWFRRLELRALRLACQPTAAVIQFLGVGLSAFIPCPTIHLSVGGGCGFHAIQRVWSQSSDTTSRWFMHPGSRPWRPNTMPATGLLLCFHHDPQVIGFTCQQGVCNVHNLFLSCPPAWPSKDHVRPFPLLIYLSWQYPTHTLWQGVPKLPEPWLFLFSSPQSILVLNNRPSFKVAFRVEGSGRMSFFTEASQSSHCLTKPLCWV